MTDTAVFRVPNRFLPFILTGSIVVVDQITKFLVVQFIDPFRLSRETVPVIGNFVAFIHTQNVGVAFSIGQNWPPVARRILFIVIPLIVVIFAGYYMIKGRDFTNLQRWALAGIIGGGLGNLVDRIFRVGGVVDFILVNMYGFLGQRYFPIFNVADSSVTVCGILLVISMLFVRPDSQELPDTGSGSNSESGRNATGSSETDNSDNL